MTIFISAKVMISHLCLNISWPSTVAMEFGGSTRSSARSFSRSHGCSWRCPYHELHEPMNHHETLPWCDGTSCAQQKGAHRSRHAIAHRGHVASLLAGLLVPCGDSVAGSLTGLGFPRGIDENCPVNLGFYWEFSVPWCHHRLWMFHC